MRTAIAASTSSSIPKIAKKIVEQEAHYVVLARKDPSFFVSYIMTDPQTGLNFEQDRIHHHGHQCISDCLWSAIELPREHGKTEQYVIGRTIWELGKNNNLRIKIVSNTEGEAMKRTSAIADHILNNERVQAVFPNLVPHPKGDWSKSKITVKRDMAGIKDPSIEAYGILSAATGGRADILIADDVCDFENTIKNPALMPKVIEAYRNKWVNLLTTEARIIYVFTRWHEKDLSHDIIRTNANLYDPIQRKEIPKETFGYLKYVIDEIKMNSISKLWPKERLIARKKSIGKRAFARNFCGRAMTSDEALFSHIDNYINWDMNRNCHETWLRFTGVDVGHREASEGSDFAYTAFFTGVVRPDDKKKIPIDIERGRWHPSVAGDKLIAHMRRNNSQMCFVENNGAQQMLIEWTKEKMARLNVSFPIKGYFTGKQKMDEETGLPAMAVDMENNNWVIPMNDGREHGRDGDSCQCGFCVWLDEMKCWPVSDFFDVGMASWLFYQASKGFSTPKNIKTANRREIAESMKGYGF